MLSIKKPCTKNLNHSLGVVYNHLEVRKHHARDVLLCNLCLSVDGTLNKLQFTTTRNSINTGQRGRKIFYLKRTHYIWYCCKTSVPFFFIHMNTTRHGSYILIFLWFAVWGFGNRQVLCLFCRSVLLENNVNKINKMYIKYSQKRLLH